MEDTGGSSQQAACKIRVHEAAENSGFHVEVSQSCSVAELKQVIQRQHRLHPAPASQRIVYAGKILKDGGARIMEIVKAQPWADATPVVHLVISKASTAATPASFGAAPAAAGAGRTWLPSASPAAPPAQASQPAAAATSGAARGAQRQGMSAAAPVETAGAPGAGGPERSYRRELSSHQIVADPEDTGTPAAASAPAGPGVARSVPAGPSDSAASAAAPTGGLPSEPAAVPSMHPVIAAAYNAAYAVLSGSPGPQGFAQPLPIPPMSPLGGVLCPTPLVMPTVPPPPPPPGVSSLPIPPEALASLVQAYRAAHRQPVGGVGPANAAAGAGGGAAAGVAGVQGPGAAGQAMPTYVTVVVSRRPINRAALRAAVVGENGNRDAPGAGARGGNLGALGGLEDVPPGRVFRLNIRINPRRVLQFMLALFLFYVHLPWKKFIWVLLFMVLHALQVHTLLRRWLGRIAQIPLTAPQLLPVRPQQPGEQAAGGAAAARAGGGAAGTAGGTDGDTQGEGPAGGGQGVPEEAGLPQGRAARLLRNICVGVGTFFLSLLPQFNVDQAEADAIAAAQNEVDREGNDGLEMGAF